MSSRVRTLSVSGGIAVMLMLFALFLPVRYVALGPGEADNTLGNDPRQAQTPVLSITGAQTYPTGGQLLLTTVSVSRELTLGEAIVRWVERPYAVVPRSVVYPPQKKQEEVDRQNQQDMVESQDSATTAALAELKQPVEVAVKSFSPGGKAEAVLKVSDVITALNGVPITDLGVLREQLAGVKPGGQVQVTVRRGTATLTVPVTTIGTPDGAGMRAILGIAPSVTSPVKVTITLSDVGGPSAGLMFALGIIDKLTPGELTAGRTIAGTGTIDGAGAVGPIGGIQQKLLGAKNRGATVFLVPEANCSEARDAGVSGLQLVRIPAMGGLHEAYDDLQRLAHGDAALTGC